MTRYPTRSGLSRAALTGVVAGLTASFVMNAFQAAVAHFEHDDGSAAEPATEQAADRIAAATGTALTDETRPAAGNAIHYAVGALLGAGYAIAAERDSKVTAGGGTAFGTVTALLLDETAVPAAGLSKAPWEFPLSTHLFGLTSHLVFGATVDAVRRALRAI